MLYSEIIAIVSCLIASYTDIRTRKISNQVVVFNVVAGLVLAAYYGYLKSSLIFGLAIFVVSLILYLIKFFGGLGDVKFLTSLAVLIPGGYIAYIMGFMLILVGINNGVMLVMKKGDESRPLIPFVFLSLLIVKFVFVL